MVEYQDPGLTVTGKSMRLVKPDMDFLHTVETIPLAEAWRRAEAANRATDGTTIVTVLLTRNAGETYYNGPGDPAIVPSGHARIETIRVTTTQPSQRRRI